MNEALVAREELEQLQIFQGVDRDFLESVRDNCAIRTLASGEVLIAANAINAQLFLLLSGRLQLHLRSLADDPVITLEAGECVGEMSLIDHQPASAFVLAAGPCRLLVLDEQQVWQLTKQHLPVAHNLLQILSQRLRLFNQLVSQERQQLAEQVQAARRSEQRFRDIVELSSDWIWETDSELRFTFLSERFQEATGLDPNTFVGQTWKELAPEDRNDVDWRAHQADLQVRCPFRNFQDRLRDADGRLCHYRISGTPVYDLEGQFQGYRGTAVDVSAEMQALERAQASETRLNSMIDNLPGAIFRRVLHTDGRISFPYYAGRIKELFGVSAAKIVNDCEEFIAVIHPAARAAWRESILASARELAPFDYELQLLLSSGDEKWLRVIAQPHQGEGGEIVWDGIDVDITESKRAEAEKARVENELREAQQLAAVREAANRAKSEFTAKMSHELRTPLNAILGFTQLLQRDATLSPSQRENIDIIGSSGEHLLALINDVLEMSKIEAGHIQIKPADFDLYQMLIAVENMLRARATGKGLKLRFGRDTAVPRFIRTDEGKLRQVLINLLGNAIKFTAAGSVTLRVGYQSAQVAKPRLEFEIEDTGAGISTEELKNLFDPFVQTSKGAEHVDGTGLGLTISRQFVELMGGEITISSDPRQGTRVNFTVVIELAKAAESGAEAQPRRVVGLAPGQPRLRILVVDDLAENRVLLQKLLQNVGFQVREAGDGQAGVALWEHWRPALIWMDMRMPVLDGYQATRQIKARCREQDIQAPVIIGLTASAFEEDREGVLAAGCDDYVRKPFHEAVIFDTMAAHLALDYIYDFDVEAPTEANSQNVPADIAGTTLAALAPDWDEQLRQAVIGGDVERMATLVEQLKPHDATVATQLQSSIESFQYDDLLAWLERVGGS